MRGPHGHGKVAPEIENRRWPAIGESWGYRHATEEAKLLEQIRELISLQGDEFWWYQLKTTLVFLNLAFLGGFLTATPASAKPPPELRTDTVYWLLMPSARLVSQIVFAVLIALPIWPLLPHELLSGHGPVMKQPEILRMVEVVLLTDFFAYWMHRLFHRVPFLWRFHAVHHSPTYVRWSTAGRVHPLNETANYLVGILPCLLLGFPLQTVLTVAPLLVAYAIAAHVDWNPPYGRLSVIFASPRFHRWHHTYSHEGGNSNFSNVFSLWDKVFGTFYLPKDQVPRVFGLDGGAKMPETYLGQLTEPFRSKDDPDHPMPPAGRAEADAMTCKESKPAAWPTAGATPSTGHS